MVEDWVKKITEETMGKSHMVIGKRIKHPDGYMVEVTDGKYWGTHGVSNFWYWKKVKKDGTLTKKIYHGYGW